jgi:hypothetical protein
MSKIIVGTRGTSLCPEFAGSTWVRLQYLLGLRRLGLDTFWVDHIYTGRRGRRSLEYLLGRFHRTATEFGFADRYCVIENRGEHYFGLSERQFRSLANEAVMLISVSGHLPSSSPLRHIPARVFVDVDPGFTQMWAHSYDMGFDRHNFFYTVGQNVSHRDAFSIPTVNIDWKTICPPVVLDAWPDKIDEQCEAFTTVADWIGSQEATFDGRHFGGKRGEFLRFIDVPQRSAQKFELALWIDPQCHADLARLYEKGWRVLSACVYAGDPHSYREFIQSSRGEFSVAKHGYVESNSGWISDRTACYLSSGKPALVQSTGFEAHIPTGLGLVTFRTLDEALSGLESINNNYVSHCRAARRLAETYFDSDVVLNRMLSTAGID